MDDADLLEAYATQRSEAAFDELVSRHIDLVYSAALRQLNGNVHAAEEITQSVFIDLAQRAGNLARHSSLVGWLYTSTHFAALNWIRTEQRRVAREFQAHQMNRTLAAGEEPEFSDLRPIIDELMMELSVNDRTALLLRFFEQQTLAAVGLRLKISENAARMRVDRALENLRSALRKRGITSSAAALVALVTRHAVSAAPTHLKAQILCRLPAAGPLTSALSRLPARWKTNTALVVAVAFMLIFLVVDARRRSANERDTNLSPHETGPAMVALNRDTRAVPAAAGAATVALAELEANQIRISCVAADAGKPVPNVEIDILAISNRKGVRSTNIALRTGICDIHYGSNISSLQLTTRSDGFADTRLHWRPDRGEAIPKEYTVRLDRSARISGRVIDADGQPVGGAEVGFNHRESPTLMTKRESHAFGWRTALADADGRWQLDCIAPELLREIYGSAWHSNHAHSPFVYADRDPAVEQQLRDGTLVFRLGRAATVHGLVRDAEGAPIERARILLGHAGETGRRTAMTQADGTFTITGAPLGKRPLTADADGFAPSTREIDVSAGALHEIVLDRGMPLRVRVVDAAERPIPRARISVDTFYLRRSPNNTAGVQVELTLQTDHNGRLTWTNAPVSDIAFRIHAAGYMDHPPVVMRPRDEEYVVHLAPALTVFGTVRDAETGLPIPAFKMITGFVPPRAPSDPPVQILSSPQWSSLDRFWLSFANGAFSNTFNEPVVDGGGYLFAFKFEAEGYKPEVTRPIERDETNVRFDIRLHRATNLILTVLGPDGRPAAGVDVGLVALGARLQLAPGRLARDNASGPGAILITDARGQVRIPADDAISDVVAADLSGFGRLQRSEFTAQSVLRLQPWGVIEGRLTYHGLAATNESLRFQLGNEWNASAFSTAFSFRVGTDDTGKFRFERVPPGEHRLVRLVPFKNGFSHAPLRSVTVESGQTSTVEVALEHHEHPAPPR